MRRLRGVALAVFVAALAPGRASAGFEVVPFGGMTRMQEGDLHCKEELQAPMRGIGAGYASLGIGLGVRVSTLAASGQGGADCSKQVSLQMTSLYLDAPLYRTEKDVFGSGGEVPFAIKGKATGTLGRLDVEGSGFAAELFYQRFFGEGSLKKGNASFPTVVLAAQVRVGYRRAEATPTTSIFNERVRSLNGPYGTLGLVVYLNPK